MLARLAERFSRHVAAALLTLLSTLAAAVTGAPAIRGQVTGPPAGAAELGLLLRQLDGVKRVLIIGAHPDDEDTSLLAALARGHGAETAYLALTRGEGGQNLIGPELEEGLGIVRTGELLAARRLDGGRQFFSRAMDFGFSRTAEEALSLWPREELLRDVVWVVRRFRPHVIVSVFSGTPRDGHGQHQAAGIMAREAFEAAADPNRFPDQLDQGVSAWRTLKLYQSSWRDPAAATTIVEAGVFDPLLGRSHFQMSMESRSQHRTQDMGIAQSLGPRSSQLALVDSRVRGTERAAEEGAFEVGGIFAGVDTAVTSLADAVPMLVRSEVRGHLQAYREAIEEARDAFRPLASAGPVKELLRAWSSLDEAIKGSVAAVGVGAEPSLTLLERRELLEDAAATALGLVVDARASDDLVVPGETFRVDVEVWNGGPWSLGEVQVELPLPPGSMARPTTPRRSSERFEALRGERAESAEDPYSQAPWSDRARSEGEALEPGALRRWSFLVQLPEDLPPSQLYYLRSGRDGALYRWPEATSLWALPRDPSLISVEARFTPDPEAGSDEADMAGSRPTVRVRRPVDFRGLDKAKGEYREPLLAVPEVAVGVGTRGMAWPQSLRAARSVTVTVTGYAEAGVSGTLHLQAPEGWKVEPGTVPFSVAGPGASQTTTFTLRPGSEPTAGRHVLRAVAVTDSGKSYRESLYIIDYEHIARALLLEPAEVTVSVFPVEVAGDLRVGYVMGSGDAGFEAIRHLGLDPELLDASDLESGALDRFDVIVLGVRAYETRPDLLIHNDRLLQFARKGGTVVVQYNKYEYPEGGFAPYPVGMARPAERVSVEVAPVTLLAQTSPALNMPNQISLADFEGWVQERGLYFLSDWDSRFTPILSMADPGEDAQMGSLLVAPVGQGLYVYTGLSFFRQLPAGVPGAHRLFANLISLKAPEWNAWLRARQGSD